MVNLAKVMEYHYPNTPGISLNLETNEILAWPEAVIEKPTQEQIDQMVIDYVQYENATIYKIQRSSEYPNLADQMDMLWHAMDTGEIPKAEQWFTAISTVKNKYPKST